MIINTDTHLSEFISMKEARCKHCGHFNVSPFLIHCVEGLRAQVEKKHGREIPVNVHCLCRCNFHNNTIGFWRNRESKTRIPNHEAVAFMGQFLTQEDHFIIPSENELDARMFMSDIMQGKKEESCYGPELPPVEWVRLSSVNSRHIFTLTKPALAIDFDMAPILPGDLAAEIHDFCAQRFNYAVFRYFKWNRPGVHWDVDTTRGSILDRVGDR